MRKLHLFYTVFATFVAVLLAIEVGTLRTANSKLRERDLDHSTELYIRDSLIKAQSDLIDRALDELDYHDIDYACCDGDEWMRVQFYSTELDVLRK